MLLIFNLVRMVFWCCGDGFVTIWVCLVFSPNLLVEKNIFNTMLAVRVWTLNSGWSNKVWNETAVAVRMDIHIYIYMTYMGASVYEHALG